MKGIILAGGSGTRLYPMTQVLSKQLLPVYDKPMIYYPLSLLMLSGIRNILIISTQRDTPFISSLLGDGARFGIKVSYAVQEHPRGLPEAFLIGRQFIADDDVTLVLGDNVFYGNFDFLRLAMKQQRERVNQFAARIFGYKVDDPHRYGVVEYDKQTNKILSLEEKPLKPKSSMAIPGLYIFDGSVADRSAQLKASSRGETEIVDLMKSYLADDLLGVQPIGRGVAWLDAGTPASLLEASQFIAAIEHRQGLKVACLEEIAIRQKFVDKDHISRTLSEMPNSPYKQYLERSLEDI